MGMGTELSVGNMVRRVLYFIREEEHLNAIVPGNKTGSGDSDTGSDDESTWHEVQVAEPTSISQVSGLICWAQLLRMLLFFSFPA